MMPAQSARAALPAGIRPDAQQFGAMITPVTGSGNGKSPTARPKVTELGGRTDRSFVARTTGSGASSLKIL